MKTREIIVNSKGDGMALALDTVEAFSKSMDFNKRDALRARLLAEETMSMVRSIVEDFEAKFWMESMPDCTCELHLLAVANMDFIKKHKLVETSTRQRNEASVGIMGKIKDFIEDQIYYAGDTLNLSPSSQYPLGSVTYAEIQMWSLQQYRKDMEGLMQEKEDGEIALLLDELEKSIVANIADDVRVSVTGNNIEMIIQKNFPINS